MIPTTQTALHDPDNGVIGNCLSAVLASLLHLPIELVPLFANNETWAKDLNVWLRPYGLAYIQFNPEFKQSLADYGIQGLHHEVAGPSPRFADVLHACVGLDCEMAFDPHPSRDGLLALETYGVFVALEPWRMLA
jgi:hypothetical protein